MIIRPALASDVSGIKRIFNHPDVVGKLGAFSSTDSTRSRISTKRPSMFVAVEENSIIGACEISSRPQPHIMRFGRVAVDGDNWLRRRVGSALYVTVVFQGLLEGRRLFYDGCVEDNKPHHQFLLSLGFEICGFYYQRTSTGKSIFEFVFYPERSFDHLITRLLPSLQYRGQIYTSSVVEKNRSRSLSKVREHLPEIFHFMVSVPLRFREADVQISCVDGSTVKQNTFEVM